MRVAICQPDTEDPAPHWEAFMKGVENVGDECVVLSKKKDIEYLKHCDTCFQLGLPTLAKAKHYIAFHGKNSETTKRCVEAHDFAVRINRKLKKLNKRKLILDAGYFRHGRAEDDKYKFYHSIGYDSIKRYANFYNSNSPKDRWEDLEVKVAPWRKGGDHILVLGQYEYGVGTSNARKDGLNVTRWFEEVIKEIREVTSRKIIFRYHPHQQNFLRWVTHDLGFTITKGVQGVCGRVKGIVEEAKLGSWRINLKNHQLYKQTSISQDLNNCWCVVCPGATNGAVEAITNGIPVITPDTMNIAYDIAGHHLEQIINPPCPNRTQWLNDLAYAQWSIKEMKQGLPWLHLREYAKQKNNICPICGFRSV